MAGKTGNETKSDKFKRIVSRRTQNVLEALRKLSKCADKNVYQYTDDEITKIFHAIETEMKRIRALFNTKADEDDIKFSL